MQVIDQYTSDQKQSNHHLRYNEFEESHQADDVYDMNRELQWAVVEVKKTNDHLMESIQHLIDGGDKHEVIDFLKTKGLEISPPASPSERSQFEDAKTPITNTINYEDNEDRSSPLQLSNLNNSRLFGRNQFQSPSITEDLPIPSEI